MHDRPRMLLRNHSTPRLAALQFTASYNRGNAWIRLHAHRAPTASRRIGRLRPHRGPLGNASNSPASSGGFSANGGCGNAPTGLRRKGASRFAFHRDCHNERLDRNRCWLHSNDMKAHSFRCRKAHRGWYTSTATNGIVEFRFSKLPVARLFCSDTVARPSPSSGVNRGSRAAPAGAPRRGRRFALPPTVVR